MDSHHYHALIWIDHQQAKVFHFSATEAENEVVRSLHPHQSLHHKANTRDSGHVGVDNEFLKRAAAAVATAGAVLITGPGSAKTELVSYIERTDAGLAKRISGVEALDHPSDGELLALGRKFFRADDRMHAQRHEHPR